jgi:hypothetical protein
LNTFFAEPAQNSGFFARPAKKSPKMGKKGRFSGGIWGKRYLKLKK